MPEGMCLVLKPPCLPGHRAASPAPAPPRSTLLIPAQVSSTCLPALLSPSSRAPLRSSPLCALRTYSLSVCLHIIHPETEPRSLTVHPSIHFHPSFLESWSVRARRGLGDYLVQQFLNQNVFFKEKLQWKWNREIGSTGRSMSVSGWVGGWRWCPEFCLLPVSLRLPALYSRSTTGWGLCPREPVAFSR